MNTPCEYSAKSTLLILILGAMMPLHGWFDADSSHRRSYTVVPKKQFGAGTRLAGFSLLLRLQKTNEDYRHLSPDGADLRFVDEDDKTPLFHRVGTWDPSGESLIWVTLPDYDPYAPKRLWLYAGGRRAAAPATQEPASLAHWHFDGAAGTSPRGLQLRGGAQIASDGLFGGGLRLNGGSAGGGALGEGDPLPEMTVALWFKIDEAPSAPQWGTFLSGGRNFILRQKGKTLLQWLYYPAEGSKVPVVSLPIKSVDTNWHQLVATRSVSGDAMALYLDGILAESKVADGPLTAPCPAYAEHTLGDNPADRGSAARPMGALLDEVRVLACAVDETWVALGYFQAVSNERLFARGAWETRAPGGAGPVALLPGSNTVEAFTPWRLAGSEAAYFRAHDYASNITDPLFFGASAGGEAWGRKPLLAYERFPGLDGVRRQARAGEYGKAAEALGSYYRSKELPPPSFLKSNTSLDQLELWYDGVIGFDQQERMVAVFAVSNRPAALTFDVSSAVKRAAARFTIMGRDKAGGLAFIASRENPEGKPTLTVRTDAREYRYEAAADTFIRAGKSQKERYGKAPVLEVCDSGVPYDDDTRRALLSFDVPPEVAGRATQASLQIRAWSEKPAARLALYYTGPAIIHEETTCWADTIGYTYSWQGAPGGIPWTTPAGAHSQFPNWIRRLPWLGAMVSASLLEKGPRLQRKTIGFLMGFVTNYPKSLRLTDPRQSWQLELDAGFRLLANLEPLRHALRLPELAPAERVLILEHLWKEGENLRAGRSWEVSDNYNNAGLFGVSGLGFLAAYFPELGDAPVWERTAFTRLDDLLTRLILPDGSYVEHTFGYPYPVLQTMLQWFEVSALAGSRLPASLKKKTEQLATYLMDVSMPDGSMVDWGEGGGPNSKSSTTLQAAARALSNSALSWWTSGGSNGTPPAYASVHYPDGRTAALRSGWGSNDLCLFISAQAGGSHSHRDQLALCLSAFGQKLLVDTGMSSYSGVHPHFKWQRHLTRSHNTIEVDEKGHEVIEVAGQFHQRPSASDWVGSADLDCYRGWADGYPNVRHARTVLYAKRGGFVIVTDRLLPNDAAEHHYDQNWHFPPGARFTVGGGDRRIVAECGGGAGLLILPGSPDKLEVLTRDGFNAIPLSDTKYPAYRRMASGPCAFATVLYPVKPGPVPAVSLSDQSTGDGHSLVKVLVPGGTAYFLQNHAEGEAPLTVGRFKLEGRAAYLFFGGDGALKEAHVVRGKALSVDGAVVVRSGGKDLASYVP